MLASGPVYKTSPGSVEFGKARSWVLGCRGDFEIDAARPGARLVRYSTFVARQDGHHVLWWTQLNWWAIQCYLENMRHSSGIVTKLAILIFLRIWLLFYHSGLNWGLSFWGTWGAINSYHSQWPGIHFTKELIIRADSRFAPNQWETALLCNDVYHWLGASIESALKFQQVK